MVIYADAVFVLNTAVNWMLLRSAARLRGSGVRWWRLVLGASVGGLYAVAVYLPGLSWMGGLFGKLLFLVIMIAAAFGLRRQAIASGVVFVLLSVGLCGSVYAVLTLLLDVPVSFGGFYPVTFSELLLTCAVSAGVMGLVLKLCTVRAGDELVPMRVTIRGQTLSFTAFRDTGNSLADPITGQPISVVEAAILAPALGRQAVRAVETGSIEQAMQLLSPFKPRLIPFRTVGTSSGILIAVCVDELIIRNVKSQNRFLALSPTRVSDRGDYHALIGGNL